jgi:hypothetical protein
MGQLYYNYRDILKAPRLALMGKNIFLMMSHLIIGYFIYLVLTYIALLIDKHSFGEIWDYFQLFPVGKMLFDSLWSKLLWYLGIIISIAIVLRGSLGVARSAFEELRGNFFFSIGEALKFIKKNCWIVYRAILGVVAFIAFLVLLGIIVGLIAKIPIVGELFYGFFYDFPFFIVSLFAALVIFLLSTLFLTGPAVVAVKGEDSMTALFDGFSAVTSQPLRWVLYLSGSVILAKVSTFILTYFSLRALQFTNWTTHIVMGDKQSELFTIGAGNVFDKFPLTDFFTKLYPGLSIDIDNILSSSYAADTSWSMTVGGFFIMLSIVFILFFITSYFLNTLICAQVIAFLDIRNATHQEKLAFIPEDELDQQIESDNP